MDEQYQSLPIEMLMRAFGSMQSEDRRIDPWQEIQELARVDPACARAVDCVRYGRMSMQEAALWLALYQTQRAIKLQQMATDWLKLNPAPLVVKWEKVDAPQNAGD